MTVAGRVLDGLGPAFRDAAGAMLDDLVDGLTAQLQVVDELAQPTPAGWATAFDLDTTPQPGWLGRATGTQVPSGLTTEQQRTYVRDRAAWRRGSVDAMAAAVRVLLDSPGRVGFIERHDANAWHLQIRVYAPEASGVTDAEILAAAAAQKPVGLIIDGVTVTPAMTYEDLAEMYDDYAELEDEGWGYPLTLEDDIPGVAWWRPAATIMRLARVTAEIATCADLVEQFPTCRQLRDHDPQEV